MKLGMGIFLRSLLHSSPHNQVLESGPLFFQTPHSLEGSPNFIFHLRIIGISPRLWRWRRNIVRVFRLCASFTSIGKASGLYLISSRDAGLV